MCVWEGVWCGVCVWVDVCFCVLHIYIRIKNIFVPKVWKKIFTTFNFCFVKLRLVTFHHFHYQIVTIILHKISICHKLQYYNNNLLTNTFTAAAWFFMLKGFGSLLCAKIEGQMATGCKLRMWTVVMFASLPHAVNFVSKPSDQYYIAVAFLHFNMPQVIQSVQCTVRRKKYSSQFINVIFDGSCNRKKQNLLFLLTL